MGKCCFAMAYRICISSNVLHGIGLYLQTGVFEVKLDKRNSKSRCAAICLIYLLLVFVPYIRNNVPNVIGCLL